MRRRPRPFGVQKIASKYPKGRGRPIIAIDGPAGSGKSTVSKVLAKRLRYLYLDTGAMYRAVTLKAMERGIDLKDEKALIDISDSMDLKIRTGDDGTVKVEMDSRDVSELIRRPDVTNNVFFIARVKGVRENLVALQRKLCERGGAVLEGRDIGTVVFPDAEHKFYLDADFKERVRRRHKELVECGQDIRQAEIERDVSLRDEKDKKREHSPLKKAEDAVYVDTTGLAVDEVVDRLIEYIRKP